MRFVFSALLFLPCPPSLKSTLRQSSGVKFERFAPFAGCKYTLRAALCLVLCVCLCARINLCRSLGILLELGEREVVEKYIRL